MKLILFSFLAGVLAIIRVDSSDNMQEAGDVMETGLAKRGPAAVAVAAAAKVDWGEWYPSVHYPPCGSEWYGYPAWISCRDRTVSRSLQSEMWKIFGWCSPTYDGKDRQRGREQSFTRFKFSETPDGVVTAVTLRAEIAPYHNKEGDGLVFRDAKWADYKYNPRTKQHDLIHTGACNWQTMFKKRGLVDADEELEEKMSE